ncbi:TfoX/Sxy family protein [bacterium]|nr:TfoX/Sxy family protein [bacterium]
MRYNNHMATSIDFINFIHDQLDPFVSITHKKMFGEYMVYAAGRPVLLVCDDTVFVKQIPDAAAIFAAHGVTPAIGTPYDGTKPHYVLDIENTDLAVDMVRRLMDVIPMPRPKTPRKSHTTR